MEENSKNFINSNVREDYNLAVWSNIILLV